jgi:hypothetical protein
LNNWQNGGLLKATPLQEQSVMISASTKMPHYSIFQNVNLSMLPLTCLVLPFWGGIPARAA